MKKTITIFISILFAAYAFATDSPSNVSPVNGSTNLDVQITLDWSVITGNTGYIYQLDTVDTFDSSYILEGSSSTNSSNITINNLYFGQTYYWRAATKTAVDTSAWSSYTSFTTASGFDNYSPSNGSASQPVEVNIDWNSISGNNGYIYEVDTVDSFDSPYLLDGTSSVNSSNVTVNNLYFGTTYYWHAAAINLTDTSEWSSTWNFTTTSEFYNYSPSNGSLNQPIEINIDWNPITGNNGYIYEIDTVNTFDSPYLLDGTSSINSSNVTVNNLYFGTTYYWHAAAKNLVDTSEWSATWDFTTIDNITNIFPTNGAVDQLANLSLDWGGITGNSGYIYRIDSSSNFNSPLLQEGSSSTNSSEIALTNLHFGTTYYWQAAAKSLVDTSNWSTIWNFTTKDNITLVSPSDAETNQNVYLELDWYTLSGVNNYDVECDTSTNFNSPLYRTNNTTSSNFYQTSLNYGTTYYWRVRGKHVSDTTSWSETRSFSTKDYVTLVSPTDGLTNQNVYLKLDWYEITGSNSYQVELDTISSFDSPENRLDEAFYSNLYESALRYGTEYFWRVRACHVNDTSEWSVVRSFSTKDYVTLVSPTDGLTNQNVYLQLDWYEITGSNSYQVELDTISSFDSPENRLDEAFYSNLYESALRYGTEYFWRVRACHVNDTSEWSAIWHFNTKGTITQIAPSNGAIEQTVYPRLSWAALSGSSEYEWEIDTTSIFDSDVLQNASTGYTYEYISNLFYDTEYFWRVCAHNTSDTSEWSNIWSFTTQSTISNISPANGATNVSVNPTLYYAASSASIGYICDVDTSLSFNSSVYQQSNSASTNITLSNLLYGTEYYWRAATRNAVDTSGWSNVWSFTTAYELTNAPVLVSPLDLSVDISFPSIGVSWNESEGAVSYQYQYSSDPSFTSNIHSYVTSLFSGTLTGLYPHTTYYWRVRGANANGYSPWSTIWEFTTESTDLTAPTLVSPYNNATNIDPATITLDWNSVFGASSYICEITTDENFISGVTTQEVSLTYKDIIGLANGTQYFWRVKSTDGVVESDWSDVWNFTTEFETLDSPILTLPTNNSTEIAFETVLMDWNSVQGASTYTYEYGTDIAFITSTITDITSETEITVLDLEPFTNYYWKVKASNGIIESDWSEVWTFRTILDVLDIPILLSPANNSTEVNYESLILDWNEVTDANEYHYEYSTDISFISDVISDFDGTTEVTLTNLFPNTQYFWRIKAVNSEAESDWSEIWNFTTEINTNVIDNKMNNLSVYPNPTNGQLTIEAESITNITLTNLQGQILLSKSLNANSAELDLSTYSNGIYLIKVETSKGVKVEKIVIE